MPSSGFLALRRFAAGERIAGKKQATPVEQCELCSQPLSVEHRHLLETATRKIVCACDACTMRFEGVLEGRFKIIPRDARPLTDFKINDAEWENLSLPINLAFFFYHTPTQKMAAMYPSPAGATESLLPLTAWASIVRQNPALCEMQQDVEALLINRVGDKRDYFLAPIDKCFQLVGTIRLHWHGLSGGEEVWQAIDEFFDRLNSNAR
jgi:hypothetical protein